MESVLIMSERPYVGKDNESTIQNKAAGKMTNEFVVFQLGLTCATHFELWQLLPPTRRFIRCQIIFKLLEPTLK